MMMVQKLMLKRSDFRWIRGHKVAPPPPPCRFCFGGRPHGRLLIVMNRSFVRVKGPSRRTRGLILSRNVHGKARPRGSDVMILLCVGLKAR